MTVEEIFPNPTVKQVIFQINFPNLFYIESKIGDLQLKIMKKFPNSELVVRQRVVFVDTGSKEKPAEFPKELDDETGKKIWCFKSDKNFELNVLGNSLAILSRYHKTYNLGKEDKFRDIIKYVLDNFFGVMNIPIITRIGLRYSDECPIPTKTKASFLSYYNSSFPLNRFDIANANEMQFITTVKKGKYSMRYMEALQKINNENKLILDFDGFAENIDSKDCMSVLDDLHKIISDEYEQTIRDPVREYMRQKVK